MLRPVARDHVRPGRRQRMCARLASAASPPARRRRSRARACTRNSGSGASEVESDRPGGVVGDDPAREVAALRMPARSAPRRRCRRSTRHRELADLEVALERRAEVGGLDRPAVRVADVRPQPEGVRPAAVGRRRERDGEVGHELRARDAARLVVGDEAVVRHAEDRPRGRVVGDGRVDRVDGLGSSAPSACRRGGPRRTARTLTRTSPPAIATPCGRLPTLTAARDVVRARIDAHDACRRTGC